MDAERAAPRAVLVPLIKVALAGDAPEATAWRDEAAAAQSGLLSQGSAAGSGLANAWAAAVKLAEGDPAVRRDETVNPTLPATCPLGLPALTATPFDLDAAVATIRDTASFG